jgi:hypothetical protein
MATGIVSHRLETVFFRELINDTLSSTIDQVWSVFKFYGMLYLIPNHTVDFSVRESNESIGNGYRIVVAQLNEKVHVFASPSQRTECP